MFHEQNEVRRRLRRRRLRRPYTVRGDGDKLAPTEPTAAAKLHFGTVEIYAAPSPRRNAPSNR